LRIDSGMPCVSRLIITGAPREAERVKEIEIRLKEQARFFCCHLR